jgi:hypothetical protein
LWILVIILLVNLLLVPQPVSAESNPHATFAPLELQQSGSLQEGWDAFWAQFKVWLAQLAEVFAQMPLVGPLLAAIFNFIGATNVWFCGALLFLMFLLGAFAIRR